MVGSSLYVGGHLCLWVVGFIFWVVMVAVWSLVFVGNHEGSGGEECGGWW